MPLTVRLQVSLSFRTVSIANARLFPVLISKHDAMTENPSDIRTKSARPRCSAKLRRQRSGEAPPARKRRFPPLTSVCNGAVGGAYLMFRIIDKAVGLRVSAEEEIDGLDYVEHGGMAYPDLEVSTYARQ